MTDLQARAEAAAERVQGFFCYGCDAQFDVRESALPSGWTYANIEALAGAEGWGIGHFDGQGHIACGECQGSVWDFIRFPSTPLPTPPEGEGA